MIEIIGGKLWQWDTGRTVKITPKQGDSVYEVHFDNGTTENALNGVVTIDGENITSEIPNIFLQSSNNITIYSVCVDENGERTEESLTVSVNARPKPDDYVYTETEVLNYKTLDERIKNLEKEQTFVNVKNFGAKGDGVTSDEVAMRNAYAYAVANLPAIVYFPKGEYMLKNGGVYLKMPKGSGGLTICGEGANQSIIKYAEAFEHNHIWCALRIEPNEKPSNEEEYLHDIIIRDLGVENPNPTGEGHAEYDYVAFSGDSVPEFISGYVFIKNDDNTYTALIEQPEDWSANYQNYYKCITIEETHGFDIQYCNRAKILNCNVFNVGDEAIDMHSCINSLIEGNCVVGSPAIGNAGGAISIGDGCNNVVVANNTVKDNLNIPYKSAFGIAVEALYDSVKNIIITGNTITNINGRGISIAATQEGGSTNNIMLSNNIITNVTYGVCISGAKPHSDIKIISCVIDNASTGLYIGTGIHIYGLQFSDFTIKNCTNNGIDIVSDGIFDCIISDGSIKDMQSQAIYCASPKAKIDNILINGVGLGIPSGQEEKVPAIQGTSKTLALSTGSILSNVTILNCKNRKAIQDIHTIINPIIEQEETKNHRAISNAAVIRGGRLNRLINGIQNDGIIDGVTIIPINGTDFGNIVINIANKSRVRITNCLIDLKNNSAGRKAIEETGTSNNNIIANNIVASSEIVTIGENTINKDNIIIPKT